MAPPEAPSGGQLRKHTLGKEKRLKLVSCFSHRSFWSSPKPRDPLFRVHLRGRVRQVRPGLSCLFPRSTLFPRSLLAPVRELLAEVHAAQRVRAFQLSAFNPLCQFALMLQREI